jgi:hypothetical protein
MFFVRFKLMGYVLGRMRPYIHDAERNTHSERESGLLNTDLKSING